MENIRTQNPDELRACQPTLLPPIHATDESRWKHITDEGPSRAYIIHKCPVPAQQRKLKLKFI